MEHEHIQELFPAYLDGRLNFQDKEKVKQHILKCEECHRELQNMEVLFKAFEEEKEVEPSDSLRAGFENMLELEKQKISEKPEVKVQKIQKRQSILPKILKFAAVGLLLFCSYLLGKFSQTQINSIPVTENSENTTQENEMLALLENTSASKRIQGVNYFEDYEILDEDILNALMDRMLNDESNNVRLTAVDALGNFTKSESVKQSLIRALKTEKDPVIQIAIIQILVKIQEKKAINPMKQLLEKDSTEQFVKEQIEALLPSIT